jgi:hypothetical protein
MGSMSGMSTLPPLSASLTGFAPPAPSPGPPPPPPSSSLPLIEVPAAGPPRPSFINPNQIPPSTGKFDLPYAPPPTSSTPFAPPPAPFGTPFPSGGFSQQPITAPNPTSDGLAGIFDDFSLRPPSSEAPTLSDSADEAGDFLPTPTQSNAPLPPVSDEVTAEVGHSSALGVDLVAAFEAEISGDGGFDPGAEASTASMPSPIIVRMRSLADRLRLEGRDNDADVILQALLLIESKSF